MVKKVTLLEVQTGKSTSVLVDADDDELAIFGAGKSPMETARVETITGADEAVQRATWTRATIEDRAAFFGGLGRCLDRNISALKSLELVAGRVKSPAYRGAIAGVARRVQSGDKFSEAFGAYPKLFTREVIALVEAGEESGRLAAICLQISKSQQKTVRILRKLKGGMIYPAIVLVIAVAVTIVMSFTLVPAISTLYASMHAQLPFATRAMMAFSDVLLHQPYLAALPFVGLLIFFRKWPAIYAVPAVQRMVIRIPVAGPLVRKSAAMMSFRVLAMLLQANVRISTSLDIVAAGASHVQFREFFCAVHRHIEEGETLSEGFLAEAYRLGADGRTIAALMQMAGETGGATEMLNEIANDYEDELDTVASQIDKILEPITIVCMGLFVGLLVYAIYGPIFNLSRIVLPKAKAPAVHVAPSGT